MTFRRLMILGALASCSLLVAGTDARASYTYSTSAVTTSVGTGLDSLTVSGAPLSGTVPLDVPLSEPLVSLTYGGLSTGNTTFTGNVTVSFTETLHSNTTNSSATFAVTEVLNITESAAGVGLNNLTATVVPTSSNGFSLGVANYVSSGTTTASLGFTINAPTAAAVPEPASLVLMGVGLVGALGIGARRLRKAKA